MTRLKSIRHRNLKWAKLLIAEHKHTTRRLVYDTACSLPCRRREGINELLHAAGSDLVLG